MAQQNNSTSPEPPIEEFEHIDYTRKKPARKLECGNDYTLTEVFRAIREQGLFSPPASIMLLKHSTVKSIHRVVTDVSISLVEDNVTRCDVLEIEIEQYCLGERVRLESKRQLPWQKESPLSDKEIEHIIQFFRDVLYYPIDDKIIFISIIHDLPF